MNDVTQGKIEELRPQQVAQLLRERKIMLVDVREPAEYARQHIPGAVLCPLSSSDIAALPADGERRIVFHCGTGLRSEKAARARLAAGAEHAAHLAGGLSAWAAAGQKVSTLSADRIVLAFAGSMVLLSLALGYFVSNWWHLLAAFVGLNLLQAAFTRFCPLAKILRKLGFVPGPAFN